MVSINQNTKSKHVCLDVVYVRVSSWRVRGK